MNRMIRIDTTEDARRAREPRRLGAPPGLRRPSGRLLLAIAALVAVGGTAVVVLSRERGIDVTYTAAPSRLTVPASIAPSVPGFVNTLRGLVDGTPSALTANGEPLTVEPGGAFTMLIPQGTAEIRLLATYPDGTASEAVVAVTDQRPVPTYPATAGLHVRSQDWADPAIHQQILDLAAAGRINAVELDIKDENGIVGYDTSVALGETIGAGAGHYDARTAVDELHASGARVIGRIVCFLDPLLAQWAWSN